MEVIRLGKYTDADAVRLDSLAGELCALFLYSGFVLRGGKRSFLCEEDHAVRTVAVSSEMYVPAAFFAAYDFADEADARLRADGVPSFVQDGRLYVQLTAACARLGMDARVYDGKLAVLAKKEILDELSLSEGLRECLIYRLFGDFDVHSLTSEDFRAVKDKWRERLVGNPTVNNASDPYVAQKLREIDTACERARSIMNLSDDAVILFGTEAPTVSADLKTQYDYLYTLARAYATFGSRFYHDEKVLEETLFGLKWMYEHMYGEAEIEERGWRSARLYDWWHWYVGGVEPLTDIMLVLEDFLTMEQKNTYLRCFRWVMTFMRVGYVEDVAMSRIRVGTKAALLTEDRDMLYDRYLDYDLLLQSDRTCKGIRADFVAWTHTYPYNMMYGFNHLSRTLYVGSLLAGTPAEFPCPKQYILFETAKYMFEPLIYRGRGSMIFNGRGVTTAEWSMGAHTIRCLLPMLGFFGADEDAHLKRMIKRNSCMPEVVNAVRSGCSFTDLYAYNAILADDGVDGSASYEIAHSYYTGDRAVQQRNDYSFILALSSNRHPAYESINGANKLGWYTGDGAVYLYTRSDPRCFDAESFMYNEKCAYNIPGTTVDTQKRIPWSHRSGLRGSRDFVGSMKVGDNCIAAVMDYAAYDYNGKTDPPTDTAYGGGFLKHKNDLTAKKAYFCLEEGCLMLGAGITSSVGYPVKTVVENRPLIADEETSTDKGILSGDDFPARVESGIRWARIADTAGYVFFDSPVLSMEKYTLSQGVLYGEGGVQRAIPYEKPHRFFTLSIEHGANPRDASYAYMVLPYADEAALRTFAEHPSVTILANTPALQAIDYPRANARMVIFHEAGEFDGYRVSAPCMLSVEEKDGERIITVCEPTQKLAEVCVTFDGRYAAAELHPEVSVESGEQTTIRIRTDAAFGYNYRIPLTRLS